MIKKRILLAGCVAVVLVSPVSIRMNTLSRQTPHGHVPVLAQAEDGVPDHVVYGFIFRKVSLITNKTKELRALGRISSKPYFALQKEAGLSEAQAKILEATAAASEQEVRRQDEKAQVIIERFRAQFPDGKIPRGVTLPPPPPELKLMWEERNAIILRARDRLRAVFGEQEFHRFDQHVKFDFGSNDQYLKRRNGSNHPVSASPQF